MVVILFEFGSIRQFYSRILALSDDFSGNNLEGLESDKLASDSVDFAYVVACHQFPLKIFHLVSYPLGENFPSKVPYDHGPDSHGVLHEFFPALGVCRDGLGAHCEHALSYFLYVSRGHAFETCLWISHQNPAVASSAASRMAWTSGLGWGFITTPAVFVAPKMDGRSTLRAFLLAPDLPCGS